MRYTKPALSIPDQIARLRGIGLVIADQARAEHALQYIGHFRLKGYFLPFMDPPVAPATNRTFKPGTTLERVLDLYQFDRKLRLLLLDQIERLEVAIRTVVCNHLSLAYGPHWYVTHPTTVFRPEVRHYDFLSRWDADARRENNPFTRHYYATYDEPQIPPCWAVAECVTFGKWSQLYQDLATHHDRRDIARAFGLASPDVFQSWLHSLTVLRNACAHHARAWNRHYAIQPKTHQGYPGHFPPPGARFHPLYVLAVVIRLLTRSYDSGNDFHAQLRALLAAHPAVPQANMGFPAGWQADPLWA